MWHRHLRAEWYITNSCCHSEKVICLFGERLYWQILETKEKRKTICKKRICVKPKRKCLKGKVKLLRDAEERFAEWCVIVFCFCFFGCERNFRFLDLRFLSSVLESRFLEHDLKSRTPINIIQITLVKRVLTHYQ